jgi:hypothetical protein
MPSVDLDMLRDLSCWQTPPCISIYLPLNTTGPTSHDATRVALKTMIGNARHQLQTDTTLRQAAIDKLLAPAHALLEARPSPAGFRADGLFSAPGCSIEAPLDAVVPALSVVADRFVAAPLVAAIPTDDRFYLLTLSNNRVRFMRGTHHRLSIVAVPALPAGCANALWYEDHERHLNVHGGAHHGSDPIIGTRHGAPSGHDLHDDQLLRYFRAVDRAL